MRCSEGSSVINIGSIYALLGPDWRLYEGTKMANPAAYAASKGGLMQLTRWLATTLAPEIRVNAIAPGGIFRNQPTEFIKKYREKVPLGRMATEADFIGLITNFSSDLSSYITGQVVVADGGLSIW
jgi:NAD(P)-dependent dehydrogenase (short-subunit alcohol dehydrogenase family)